MNVPTIPKPNVEAYEQANGDVCLTPDNASEFFEYVYTLEVTLEDLRGQ